MCPKNQRASHGPLRSVSAPRFGPSLDLSRSSPLASVGTRRYTYLLYSCYPHGLVFFMAEHAALALPLFFPPPLFLTQGFWSGFRLSLRGCTITPAWSLLVCRAKPSSGRPSSSCRRRRFAWRASFLWRLPGSRGPWILYSQEELMMIFIMASNNIFSVRFILCCLSCISMDTMGYSRVTPSSTCLYKSMEG